MSSAALDIDRIHDLDVERTKIIGPETRVTKVILHPNLGCRYPKPIIQNPWPENETIQRLLNEHSVPNYISLKKTIDLSDTIYGWKYVLSIKFALSQQKPNWRTFLRRFAPSIRLPSEVEVRDTLRI